MLEGCTPWPSEFATRYRAEGYWEDITLWRMIERAIARWPHKMAIVEPDGAVSYRDLGSRIERLAFQFRERALAPGERVVVQLPNGLEFIVTFLALVRVGIVPVLMLPAHRQVEVGHVIAHSEAVAYVAPARWRDYDYRPMATEMRRRFKTLRKVFIAGDAASDQIPLSDLMSASTVTNAQRLEQACPSPDDVSHLLLSGGTTGLPKLIPRTHNDYVYNCKQSGAVAGFNSDTVFLAVLPMAHNFTLGSPGVLGALATGGTAVIAANPRADTVFPLIARERVTLVSAALPLVVSWLNTDEPERHDLSSLKVFMSGGAKLVPELRKRVEQRLHCIYQESFGTGEGLLCMTRLDDPLEIRMTSSGAPISPGDEIQVLDEAGREVADGTVGELACRGPYTVRGYYKAPEASRAAFTAGGFFRMGDAVRRIGRQIYVEGRLKDLINRGGEKISSEEVENHLIAHPKIRSACVVAMPDTTFGEKACAFVVPRDGAPPSLDDLKNFLISRGIAKFKLPEHLEIVAELPTSPAGKIVRRELRQVIAAKIKAERAGSADAASASIDPTPTRLGYTEGEQCFEQSKQ
jgi:2,3-dihydroxybenzoate-AMP ligase